MIVPASIDVQNQLALPNFFSGMLDESLLVKDARNLKRNGTEYKCIRGRKLTACATLVEPQIGKSMQNVNILVIFSDSLSQRLGHKTKPMVMPVPNNLKTMKIDNRLQMEKDYLSERGTSRPETSQALSTPRHKIKH